MGPVLARSLSVVVDGEVSDDDMLSIYSKHPEVTGLEFVSVPLSYFIRGGHSLPNPWGTSDGRFMVDVEGEIQPRA